MRTRRIMTGASLPLLLAACAGGQAATPASGPPSGPATVAASAPGDGTVTGIFHREGGPLGPGGTPPRTVPLSGRIRFKARGRPAVLVRAGPAGRFTAQLPPGVYRVTGITHQIVEQLASGRELDGRCRRFAPVTVRPGQQTRIAVTCMVP